MEKSGKRRANVWFAQHRKVENHVSCFQFISEWKNCSWLQMKCHHHYNWKQDTRNTIARCILIETFQFFFYFELRINTIGKYFFLVRHFWAFENLYLQIQNIVLQITWVYLLWMLFLDPFIFPLLNVRGRWRQWSTEIPFHFNKIISIAAVRSLSIELSNLNINLENEEKAAENA